MRIAVFGASGGIGRFVVQHALERGFEVNAYIRETATFHMESAGLHVFTGELSDSAAITNAISGCDAVVSALGVPLKFTYPSMASLEGHQNIIRAMQKLGVPRLIGWATPSARFSGDTRSFCHRHSRHPCRAAVPEGQEGDRRHLRSNRAKRSSLDDRPFRGPQEHPVHGQGEGWFWRREDALQHLARGHRGVHGGPGRG